MNRIVREHYPVEKLPDDLREGLEAHGEVRVTVEFLAPVANVAKPPYPEPGLFSRYRHLAVDRFRSMEEIDAHVAAMRDEWDHRER